MNYIVIVEKKENIREYEYDYYTEDGLFYFIVEE